MSEARVYLVDVRCPDHGDVCGETTTFAVEGPKVPVDQDAPLPDVETCPKCGGPFDADLAVDVVEVREAVVVDPLAEVAEILDRFYGGDSTPEKFRMILDEAEDIAPKKGRDQDRLDHFSDLLATRRKRTTSTLFGQRPDEEETAIEERARRAREDAREEFIEQYGVDPEDLDVGDGGRSE